MKPIPSPLSPSQEAALPARGVGLVYRNLRIYRLVMTFLEKGRYQENTQKIARMFDEKERVVLELCFGDTILAKECHNSGRRWIGLDINPAFVAEAQHLGFDARQIDLTTAPALPKADLCVMNRAAYHFNAIFEQLLVRMFNATPRIIIMEGLGGLSSQPGLIGWISRHVTNVGKGPESFRYNRDSLVASLTTLERRVGFSWEIASETPHEMVVVLRHD